MAKKKERYIEKRNGIFYFRKTHNGRPLKRSLNTSDPKKAKELRDLYLANLIEYGQLDPPQEPEVELVTFGKVAKEWAIVHKAQVRHSTWRDYVSIMNDHILPKFKDVLITEITCGDVIRFRNRLKVGAKRANNILVPMKSVFDFAKIEGLIQDNVLRDIRRLPEEAPEINPFSYDEVNRILEAIDPWYRPYTSVAFFTGMRAGELNGLQWADFMESMRPEPHIFIHKTYVYKKDSIPKTKKSKRYISCLPQVLGSGGRIRTTDLRVMSPTSYQTAPPRGNPIKIIFHCLDVN
jgi:hypothetical protein